MAGELTAKRVRTLREARELSMDELCEIAKVSKATLWRIENNEGVARTDTLQKLASALEVSFAYISGESDAVGDLYAEDTLSPLERKLLNEIREGRTVDALDTFHALSSGKK